MGSVSNLWRRLGGAPDPLGDDEVAGEIEVELAFHLEQRERELIAQGLTPEAARTQALQRFGDIEKIRAECRRVQLGGRIMLQRATLGILVILIATVAWLSVLHISSRRASQAEISSLKSQIEQLEDDIRTPAGALEDLERFRADILESVGAGNAGVRKLIREHSTLTRTSGNLEHHATETQVLFSEF